MRTYRIAGRPTVAARVKHVVELMSKGQWQSRMGAELAAKWGISLTAMRTATAEASRFVHAAIGDAEEVRGNLWTKLENAYAMAEKQGDVKAMVMAAATMAKLWGVEAPQKIALTDARGVEMPVYLHVLATIAGGVEWFAALEHNPSESEVAAWVHAHRPPALPPAPPARPALSS